MNRKTLRKLERHCTTAADIITSSVVNSVAEDLADPEADPRDSLAALADACTLHRIARDARTVRNTPSTTKRKKD